MVSSLDGWKEPQKAPSLGLDLSLEEVSVSLWDENLESLLILLLVLVLDFELHLDFWLVPWLGKMRLWESLSGSDLAAWKDEALE